MRQKIKSQLFLDTEFNEKTNKRTFAIFPTRKGHMQCIMYSAQTKVKQWNEIEKEIIRMRTYLLFECCLTTTLYDSSLLWPLLHVRFLLRPKPWRWLRRFLDFHDQRLRLDCSIYFGIVECFDCRFVFYVFGLLRDWKWWWKIWWKCTVVLWKMFDFVV